MERHPLSAVWGDMPAEAFDDLVEAMPGYHDSDLMVWTLDGMVLDGWHRLIAATAAGRERDVLFVPYNGDDPVGFVIDRNGYRRHLTKAQLAQILVRIYQQRGPGRPANTADSEPVQEKPADSAGFSPMQEELAEKSHISARNIRNANLIERAGLGDEVISGEMSQSEALQQAREPEDDQPPAKPAERSPVPRPLSPKEVLQVELDAAKIELQEKDKRIEVLERGIREAKSQMSDYPHERESVAQERETLIASLRASLGECQAKYNDLLLSHRAAVKRLRELDA